jgi:hypothetical protein
VHNLLVTLILAAALATGPEPASQVARPEPRKHGLAWALPVAGSILTDQWTTQRALAVGLHEANPVPGMGSLGGRVAWHSAELALIAGAVRSDSARVRKAGRIGAVVSVLIHGGAAWINVRHRAEALRMGARVK